ncbi:ribonucleoside-triphosphate reductase, adenosylcobalamin-dependent [Clostridium felsineum]|uniref:ribonucleoside-triphosphate reductase, adenosylcobalamin-dependent n=1 Tax=Clostridium felsineum TaxID=36839 RepID=UPI00098CC069|nr:ribonucleoside-triphosphate reductase, adenosylcobalamin-dependent [Clostridium felsineum]URZ16903.1 Adenosylcobalamin-dependent ribonucleoside-triphosphate reductase [Clostridium felsineum DSM 794]
MDKSNNVKLSNEFLKQYPDYPEAMSDIGRFTYLRTYSRWLEGEKRRETWKETVARAVQYNCNTVEGGADTEEAEALFDVVFNLKGFLSGRTLWIGGTEAVEKHALANFNCSAVVLDSFEKLSELFYALMCGTGVGFRAMQEDVEYLPKMRKLRNVEHMPYIARSKENRLESTSLEFYKDMAIIRIGDSKEGWIQSLRFFFNIITRKEYSYINEILFNYDSVRPKGERLHAFGGTASGHGSLLNMYKKMTEIINRDNTGSRAVTTLDMLDFATIIAENVVVGGVRRSAEIGLIGADDKACIEAKSQLYTQDKSGNWGINNEISHRRNSNNTIIHWEKPSKNFWHWQLEQMRYSGEPGFYNGEHARKRKPNFKVTNPCAEVLLDDRQTCNLVTTNVMAHVKDGVLDVTDLERTHALLTRASYRLTCIELELSEWDKMLHRDRLLGVSLTGWQDMVNAVGLDKNMQASILRLLRSKARESADFLSDGLGLNRSELVTTVKPEGTLSLLPTVSSGLHFSHSGYYIRRIRINADDALVKVCKLLGYPIYPEVGQEMETANTLVIEFPVKAPQGRTKFNVSAIEQLETYKLFMENYVDHNASITVSVRENEWAEVEQWVYDNWDSCVGISFLSLDDSYYQLLPYEAITKEEYEKRAKDMLPIDSELLKYFENGADFDIGNEGCEGGLCPIR